MDSNNQMVDRLKAQNHIKSPEIEEAFRRVDRADFVEKRPYADRPYLLKEESTVSAPHMVADMLELLEPEGRVLEMGSGSGYVLALLTHLCDDVVGVELDEDLVLLAREKVANAKIIHGDSLPDQEFDRILYSFAVKNVQHAITKSDVVVAPLIENSGQVLYRFRNGDKEKHGYVRFVKERKGLR